MGTCLNPSLISYPEPIECLLFKPLGDFFQHFHEFGSESKSPELGGHRERGDVTVPLLTSHGSLRLPHDCVKPSPKYWCFIIYANKSTHHIQTRSALVPDQQVMLKTGYTQQQTLLSMDSYSYTYLFLEKVETDRQLYFQLLPQILTIAHQLPTRSLCYDEVLRPVSEVLQVKWDSILGVKGQGNSALM